MQPEFTDEEEARKWQLFEEQIKQAEAEQRKRPPDLFYQRTIGFIIGLVLGPAALIALFYISVALYPDAEAGGPLAYLFLLVISVPLGGIFCTILSPFIVRIINRLRG